VVGIPAGVAAVRTRTTLTMVRIMATTTCPVRWEAREMAMVRNRAMMPWEVSG